MGEKEHYACFKTLCLHPDYTSSHIDKTFVNKHAHRMLSSYILCVMTSTDNIIDAVVTCVYIYDYLSTSQPKYIVVSIHWGKYCVHCFKKKRLWRKAACPIRKYRKNCTDQRKSLDPSTISALLSAKLYNQS